MSRAAFDALLASVADLFEARPILQNFAPFPTSLSWAGLSYKPVPAAALVAAWDCEGDGPEDAVHRAAQGVVPHADWRQTYTEAEVGRRFLDTYGYFEIYGPSGHYHCENARGFVAYWGAGLSYDWHDHLAEELYFVLSGSALFQTEGEPDAVLSRGGTRQHAPNQPHAMKTQDEAVLVFVPWRGDGLSGLPKMCG